ncbi:MAG: YoaK family protein [Eubacterium sp.]
MKSIKSKQMSENFILGIFLASVGGYLDAYTYFIRGKVFANAQTGNIVLLGISIANGDFSSAIRYIIPILAFTAGILLTELLKFNLKENHIFHWRQYIVLLEAVILFSTSFIQQGKLDIIVNAMVSFVCAMQVESFRVISGNKIATTMCTGNLRSGTEMLFHGIKAKDKKCIITSLTYYTIIIAFIVGAITGTFLTRYFFVKSIYAACILLIAPFFMMFKVYKNND